MRADEKAVLIALQVEIAPVDDQFRALVDARRSVMSLALVNIPENVYRVIELSGTTDLFAIYDSEETALSAFNSH